MRTRRRVGGTSALSAAVVSRDEVSLRKYLYVFRPVLALRLTIAGLKATHERCHPRERAARKMRRVAPLLQSCNLDP